MTISSTVNRVPANGNGVTLDFAFGYLFNTNADLVVLSTVTATGVSTTKILNTDYTVTGAGNPGGGTVTYIVAPPTGTTVTIYRDPAATQTVDYLEGDPFPAETHEGALDKLTMLAQRTRELVDRSIHVPDGDSSSVITALPSAVDRANKFFYFDSSGNASASAQVVAGTLYFTPTTQLLSGTGAQTVFTLNVAPGTSSAIILSISGVTQKPGVDFTTSGTALTFTTAPALGTNNIAVQNFGIAGLVPDDTLERLAAPSGSSLVGTQNVGTGALARTQLAVNNAIVRTGDYDTAGHFNTASEALTEKIGAYGINVMSTSLTEIRTILKWQPKSSNRGPFVISGHEPLFNGNRDPAINLAYNMTIDGTLIVAGEPGFGYQIEGYYDDASGAIKMEAYFQYVHSDGITNNRPMFIQMNRTTGKIQTHRLKGDIIQFVADDGNLEAGSASHIFTKNGYTLYAPDATLDTAITMVAASGKMAIFDMQNNGVSNLKLLATGANGANITISGTPALYLFSTPIGGAAAGSISVGVQDNGAAGTFATVSASDGVASLVARAKSTQSVDTFQVQNSSSAKVASINKTGTILACGQTAIPAGGTAATGYAFSTTANFGVFFGSGAPSLSAAKGSLYLRSDGSGTTDRAYINTNGTTTWTALTTVA